MTTPNDPFLGNVRETVTRHAMFEAGDSVLAAVSGGPDSMCLLHVLLDLGARVTVAHLDHCTRDGESAEDAVFVGRVVRDLGLPGCFERRNVEEEAAASPDSFEEYARKARYAFLHDAARSRGCAVIATGHHGDDQAETVLMRVLRGSGPRGLRGIPPVREDQGPRIVRPLIRSRRDAILDWVEARGIGYRMDISNDDASFLRNRVRQELIPWLEEHYNPALVEALCRTARLHQVENDLMESLAKAFAAECVRDGTIDRLHFRSAHPALQQRLILSLAWRSGVECSCERVAEAAAHVRDAPAGQTCDLGGGVVVRNERDRSELVRADDAHGAPPAEATPLPVPGEVVACGRVFRTRRLDAVPVNPADYCSPTRQVIDARAITGELAVRCRRPGDRIAPLGLGGTKKLKDYFMDACIPRWQRDRIPLVVSGDQVLWVVGHAVSAAAAIRPGTQSAIAVEVGDAAG